MIRKIKLVTEKEIKEFKNAFICSNNMNFSEEEAKEYADEFIKIYNNHQHHIYANYENDKITGLVLCSINMHNKDKIKNTFCEITSKIQPELTKIGISADVTINFIACDLPQNQEALNKIIHAIEFDLLINHVNEICFYMSNPKFLGWAYDQGFELLNTLEIDLNDIKGWESKIISLKFFHKIIE